MKAPASAFRFAIATLALATAFPVFAGEKSGETDVLPRQLDLATARSLAIQHNRSIAQARESIRERQGVVVEARSAFFPRLDLSAGYDYTDKERIESFGGLFAPLNQKWVADLTVSYNLLDGRFRDANSEAARAAKAAARSRMEAVLDEVLLQVALRYFDALLAVDRVDVQKKAITVLDEQLTYAKNRFDAGAGPQFNVLQAEVALANAKPGLVRAEGQYKVAIDQLRRTIGLDYPEGAKSEDITLADRWPDAKLRHSLDEAIHAALENRPELASLRSGIEAERQRIAAEKARHKPKLQVVGGYGAQSLNFSGAIDDGISGWTAGLRLSIPLFDAGLTKGRVQQAESRLRQAELGAEQETFDIEGEVREAWIAWEEGSTILETSRLVVEQGEEALRLARSSFEAGAATQLEVLQSQLELTRSRLEEVVALHTYHSSLARLRRAMGEIAAEE